MLMCYVRFFEFCQNAEFIFIYSYSEIELKKNSNRVCVLPTSTLVLKIAGLRCHLKIFIDMSYNA